MNRLGNSALPAALLQKVPFALFLSGIVLTAVGIGQLIGTPQLPDAGRVPPASAAPSFATAAVASSDPRSSSQVPQPILLPARPLRLQLPATGVDAPVIAVSVLAGGSLAVPDDPQLLGWWSAGATPGTGRGTVVIDGHVDSATAGLGALFALTRLRPGQPVWLSTSRGRLGYTVRAVRSYLKSRLPAEVFATDGNPRLVIISCGGSFNRQTLQYDRNIVVYATPN